MPGFLADVLSQPDSAYYVLAIKTAITWGESPMDILIPKHTRERMADVLDFDAIEASDRKLKMAWQILNDETCKQCGNPIWICRSTDNNIGFHVDSTTCYAEEAINTYKKNNPGADKSEVTFFAKPFTYIEGSALPSRASFMERQARAVTE